MNIYIIIIWTPPPPKKKITQKKIIIIPFCPFLSVLVSMLLSALVKRINAGCCQYFCFSAIMSAFLSVSLHSPSAFLPVWLSFSQSNCLFVSLFAFLPVNLPLCQYSPFCLGWLQEAPQNWSRKRPQRDLGIKYYYEKTRCGRGCSKNSFVISFPPSKTRLTHGILLTNEHSKGNFSWAQLYVPVAPGEVWRGGSAATFIGWHNYFFFIIFFILYPLLNSLVDQNRYALDHRVTL